MKTYFLRCAILTLSVRSADAQYTPRSPALATPQSTPAVIHAFSAWDYIRIGMRVGALAVMWAAAVLLRKHVRNWLASGGWKLGVAKTFAYGAAIATTVAVSWFEPWKPTTWTVDPVSAVYDVLIVATLGTIGFFAEWARTANDSSDRQKLSKLRAAHEATERQLDNWVRGSTQIGAVLGKKLKVFRELSRAKSIAIKDFLDALRSDQYVFHNLHAIYEFVHRKLPAGAKLRIALYHCQDNCLVPLYSWDGEKTDCVRPNTDAMRTNSAAGVQSAVVECFHTAGTGAVVPVADCTADQKFQHFRPGQSDYLKSMIAFKHRLEIDGTGTAMVLALDCDQAGFFDSRRAEELKSFFSEMMKRVEYEALTSDITSKLVQNHKS